MLEGITPLTFLGTAYRFAVIRDTGSTLEAMNLSEADIAEVFYFFRSRGGRDDLDLLLEAPFGSSVPRRRRLWKSRFSDGSHPVLYSALDRATSESEVRYWFTKNVIKDPLHCVHYYDFFSFRYVGHTIDLRPMLSTWPNLTHSHDYTFCNRLGAEAVAAHLEGFVAPSARHPGGSCLPVFARRAVSSPRRIAYAAFSLNPASGEVAVSFSG